MNYYNVVKRGCQLSTDQSNKMKIDFFNICNSRKVIPLPSFTKIKDKTLYLTQIIINDIQAQNLQEFLVSHKDVSEYQIKMICIDDCGMTDVQFSRILKGLSL